MKASEILFKILATFSLIAGQTTAAARLPSFSPVVLSDVKRLLKSSGRGSSGGSGGGTGIGRTGFGSSGKVVPFTTGKTNSGADYFRTSGSSPFYSPSKKHAFSSIVTRPQSPRVYFFASPQLCDNCDLDDQDQELLCGCEDTGSRLGISGGDVIEGDYQFRSTNNYFGAPLCNRGIGGPCFKSGWPYKSSKCLPKYFYSLESHFELGSPEDQTVQHHLLTSCFLELEDCNYFEAPVCNKTLFKTAAFTNYEIENPSAGGPQGQALADCMASLTDVCECELETCAHDPKGLTLTDGQMIAIIIGSVVSVFVCCLCVQCRNQSREEDQELAAIRKEFGLEY